MIPLSEHRRRLTQVSLTPAVVKAARLHSKKYAGYPRPQAGSLSHYVWVAVLNQLRRDGLDVEKSGWYDIPKKSTT